MPLSTIQAWPEATTYLTELRDTVRANVRPLLQIPGGAPFSVCREVFCYLDHLGHLFTGSNQVGQRFTSFLRTVMSTADDGYREWADVIYQMLRNGSVHEFAPKVLENNQGQLLGWGFYGGPRNDATHGPHLRLRLEAPGLYTLPVSSPCLLDDLEAAIEVFRTLGIENERVTLWNRAARELTVPRPFNFPV